MARRIFIGTAGWSIPRASAEHCPGDGTHLQRYARVFRAVEINSSFHRPHGPETYRKWARSTGLSFRFAVKLPRVITHDLKLRAARVPLEQWFPPRCRRGASSTTPPAAPLWRMRGSYNS